MEVVDSMKNSVYYYQFQNDINRFEEAEGILGFSINASIILLLILMLFYFFSFANR